MNLKKSAGKAIAGTAAVAALTTAVVGLSPGPASASMGPNRVQLCANGNYDSDLEFRTNLASYISTSIVANAGGPCIKVDIPSGTGMVVANLLWNSNAGSKGLGGFYPDAGSSSVGWKVYMFGSSANGAATAGFSFNQD